MKRNYTGCAICDSTWGDVWEEVEGERMFFCCTLCAVQFRGLVARIRQQTGWPQIDGIEIEGGRRGRTVRATRGEKTFQARVMFGPEGDVLTFEALPPDPALPTRP